MTLLLIFAIYVGVGMLMFILDFIIDTECTFIWWSNTWAESVHRFGQGQAFILIVLLVVGIVLCWPLFLLRWSR